MTETTITTDNATKTNLTEEDIRNITLRYKINGLSMIANMIPTNYQLYKISPLNGRILKKPDIKEIEKYDIGLYLNYDEQINDVVRKFVETLTKHQHEININTLYNNLKSLKVSNRESSIITKIKKLFDIPYAAGYYNPELNKVVLHKDLIGSRIEVITHELLHFSSTILKGDILYSGFSQAEISSYRGYGINEGTTEYINSYLFGYPLEDRAYKELVYLTKGIANLIGSEKLIQLYFNNDLEGLISEISKYTDEKTASTLIIGMDKFLSIKYQNVLGSDFSITTEKLKESLISLVATLNMKKQKEMLNNDMVTQEEFDNNRLINVELYEIGLDINQKIDTLNGKTIYTIKFINDNLKSTKFEFNETEYKKMVSELKKEILDKSLEKKQKKDIINKIIKQITHERTEVMANSDNVYMTTKGYSDISGKSLDNIQFNYKSLSELIKQAQENKQKEINIRDISGIIHTVKIKEAMKMKKYLILASQTDYKITDVEPSEHDEEMKEIMDDYNNSKEQVQLNNNNKEI